MQFSIVWQQTLILASKVTIDLDFLGERSLQQELAEADFAAEKPSLFVAEGLIMYLGPEGILSSSSVRAKTHENWWFREFCMNIGQHFEVIWSIISLRVIACTQNFCEDQRNPDNFCEKSCKTLQVASKRSKWDPTLLFLSWKRR